MNEKVWEMEIENFSAWVVYENQRGYYKLYSISPYSNSGSGTIYKREKDAINSGKHLINERRVNNNPSQNVGAILKGEEKCY